MSLSTPFSTVEAALLDTIEKATFDNIILQHGNHEAAHKATIDKENAQAELGKLAIAARKSGDDAHFKLLFNEMNARIERATSIANKKESAAGQFVRGDISYQPLGNCSIFNAA